MKLTRPLNVLDLETTGTDISRDRIVQLAVIQVQPDGTEKRLEQLFNPGFPMSEEVIAIHGITNEMVHNQPAFVALAPVVHEWFKGCDLAGYNAIGFDIPMLWEEFHRAGIEWLLAGLHILDAFEIFRKKEPRDLTAALQFYCYKELHGAHNAMRDVLATYAVLLAQTASEDFQQAPKYADIRAMDTAALARFCQSEDRPRVDLCGTIVLKNGVPVFNTKRNRDVPVTADVGYAEWILRSDFPQSTKSAIRKILSNGAEHAGQPTLF